MAALAGEFPDVHQTFNLVPSLVLQLEEYAAEKAQDASLELAFKHVDELSAGDRSLIIGPPPKIYEARDILLHGVRPD